MLKLSHANATFLSGVIWMAIGIFLLQLGLKLLLAPVLASEGHAPLIGLLGGFFSHHEAAIVIITLALYIGFLKGKHVLAKTANRMIRHIQTLPNPTPIHHVYGKKYLMLIGVMVLLGMAIKYFSVPNDVRGAIDIAVGAALIHGAIHYFRSGIELRKSTASANAK